MHDERELLAGCGEFCGLCPHYLGEKRPGCPGCVVCKGHPFWGTCNIYQCISSHGVAHCGVCNGFPCDQFIGHYDPNNPEGQRNAVVRVGVLAYRTKQGDEKALTLLKKLGKPPRA